MIKKLGVLALLLVLPSCVAAIGNKGYGLTGLPKASVPSLQERVNSAQRVVQLNEQRLAAVRQMVQEGVADSKTAIDAEIAVEEARIRMLQFRAELEAIQSRKDDD